MVSTSSPRLADLPRAPAALAARYRAGEVPPRLEGRFDGRLLPVGPARVARLVPWLGKTIRDGEGRNRLRLIGERFPFHVAVGSSSLDGRPCLVLDYDRRDNPPPIRRLVDELRRVGPDLYLGPGMMHIGGRLVTWTWFALAPT